MFRTSRRAFVGWLGALGALLGTRRARSADVVLRQEQPESLPAVSLAALAGAVLPSTLGPDGAGRAARAFATWIAEYRTGSEVLHGYGTEQLAFLPAVPLRAWRSQLAALDRAARAAHGRPFGALGTGERQAVVRRELDGVRPTTMPSIASAPHVALALLAHFYESSEATNLCYGVQLNTRSCRPLVHNSRQPLPLARGGRT